MSWRQSCKLDCLFDRRIAGLGNCLTRQRIVPTRNAHEFGQCRRKFSCRAELGTARSDLAQWRSGWPRRSARPCIDHDFVLAHDRLHNVTSRFRSLAEDQSKHRRSMKSPSSKGRALDRICNQRCWEDLRVCGRALHFAVIKLQAFAPKKEVSS